MRRTEHALRVLAHEAQGLLVRLGALTPFSLRIPTVAAAGVEPRVLRAFEARLAGGREEMGRRISSFLAWLDTPAAAAAGASRAQQHLALLRLRLNAVHSEFDIFSDAMAQRAESGTGPLLAGLDAVARDLLALPGTPAAPPIVCYLDRGGAAIRRARTRLPSGARNEVAVVRLPYERMVGLGVAGTLAHECGHEFSTLLGLVPSLRPSLRALATRGARGAIWARFERTLAEALSDAFAVARVGVASVLGLFGVLGLPRAFVFRWAEDAVHPSPALRVPLACAFGDVLHPHPQWAHLAQLWGELYPDEGAREPVATLLRAAREELPAFVRLVVDHRPRALGGRSLAELLGARDRAPVAFSRAWRRGPATLAALRPSHALAVMGQARADGELEPRAESEVLSGLLTRWALRESTRAAPRRFRLHVSHAVLA
jgi:hypothetical protein